MNAPIQEQQNSICIIDNVNLQQVSSTMQKIAQFQTVIQRTLKKDHDYGVIPGTGNKPTLLKPGAEKILMLMGLTSEYEIVDKVQDYEGGFFAFTIKCTIFRNDLKITEGVGHANTKEARYARRWVTEKKLPEGSDKSSLPKREREGKYGKYIEYQIDNDDPYTLANTVLKMAKKRAQVDAVLTVASLSEIFTQDLEDYTDEIPQAKQQQYNQRPEQAKMATDAQRKRLFSMSKETGISSDYLKLIVQQVTGKTSSKELTMDDIQNCFSALEEIIKAKKTIVAEGDASAQPEDQNATSPDPTKEGYLEERE